MRNDEIVFRSNKIVISKTLAKFGSKSYPINGIGSVYIDGKRSIVFLLLWIAVAIYGLLILVGSRNLVGAGLLAIGAGMFVFSLKPDFELMIKTASGDQQVFKTRNWQKK